jgi:hypothetical protein
VAETGSEDEAVDMSEDDFFMAGSSSDDVDADDEWTDKSPRFGEERDDTSKELVSSTPRFIHNKASKSLNAAVEKRSLKSPKHAPPKGKDQSSVKVLMPPPTTRGRGSTSNATVGNKLRSSSSSHMQMGKRARYSQLSSSTSEEHVRAQTRGSSSSTIFENVKTTTLDIQRSKPKRKRRPKKKKTT